MDRSQKLDKVSQLVSYSGLEARRAEDLLEKTGWNVDAAYRLYKNSQMEQHGYRIIPGSNRNSQPLPSNRPVMRQGAMHSGRPVTDFTDGFGPIQSGFGTAVAAGHPAFRPPDSVPKFPVDVPERIIPIQIEMRTVPRHLEKKPGPATGPATYAAPHTAPSSVPSKPHTKGSNVHIPSHPPNHAPSHTATQPKPAVSKGDNFPGHRVNQPSNVHPTIKGDKFPGRGPVPLAKQPLPPIKGDNAPQLKGGSHPAVRGDHPPPNPVAQPAKPVVIQETAEASTTPKVLKRGISKISQNAMLVDAERQSVLQDIAEDCHDNMYVQTFVLPDVTGYSEDFRAFLEKDLIETSTLVSLEQAGRLNWWAEMGVCQRLLPMATTGDGNCLLHAASLAMWGIHDRQLMLRKALYETLTKKYYRAALYRRWRWQQTQANKQAGLIFSEEEWQAEWDNVLRLSSTTPRTLPNSMQRKSSCCDSPVTQSTSSSAPRDELPVVYESLEEFHVFVLAHVIQRPIIIVADTILRDSGGDALAPIPFGGIYLPLECDSSHCYMSPLLLTYDAAHFSALVPMEKGPDDQTSSLPVAIPIVGPGLEKIPVHFSIDPGVHYDWQKTNATITMSDENIMNMLKKYLEMDKLPFTYMDSNGDDKNSTGSYESDDGLVEKGRKKDNKVSQQLQTVSKQFGSFGKSVGKKIKNLGKGNKEDKRGHFKGKRPSLGGEITQSTRLPLTIAALGSLGELDQQLIWCATIVHKRTDTHQKMIDNYLFDAGERFKKTFKLTQQKNSEIMSRVHGSKGGGKIPCVISGCNLYGTVETSYLCNHCFDEQKRQAIDQEKEVYDSYSNRQSKNGQDSGCKVGKSKFYDMQNGVAKVSVGSKSPPINRASNGKGERMAKVSVVSKSPPVNRASRESPHPQLVVDLSTANSGTTSNAKNVRTRSPSPDYDNVNYKELPKKQTSPVTANMKSPKLATKHESRAGGGKLCLNKDCQFYGNKDMGGLCSGCYKKLQQQQQLQRV